MCERIAVVVFAIIRQAVGQEIPQPKPEAALVNPVVVHADLPLYPAVALSAHLSGPIDVAVQVENGAVIELGAAYQLHCIRVIALAVLRASHIGHFAQLACRRPRAQRLMASVTRTTCVDSFGAL